MQPITFDSYTTMINLLTHFLTTDIPLELRLNIYRLIQDLQKSDQRFDPVSQTVIVDVRKCTLNRVMEARQVIDRSIGRSIDVYA